MNIIVLFKEYGNGLYQMTSKCTRVHVRRFRCNSIGTVMYHVTLYENMRIMKNPGYQNQ